MQFIVLIIVSYLLGSIPFGYLIAKSKHVDIQKVGSGNIGATNVHRVLGWKCGLLTLLLDVAKGFAAITLVNILFNAPMVGYYILAGSLAIFGHFKPVWLRWRGGKAVATSLGVILALLPIWFALVTVGVFIVAWAYTRQVSVGSMSAALAAVAVKLIFGGGFSQQDFAVTTFLICIAGLIMFAHRQNIKRLLAGNEPKT